MLKHRIHASLIAFGHPCPVSDLFGLAGRELLDRMAISDPWRRTVDASRELIDDLELQIAQLTVEMRRQGADHRYVPLLVTAPGFGWINAFTSRATPTAAARSPRTARAICAGRCSKPR